MEVRRPTRFRFALFTTPVSYRNVAEYPEMLSSSAEGDDLQLTAVKAGVRTTFVADRGKQPASVAANR